MAGFKRLEMHRHISLRRESRPDATASTKSRNMHNGIRGNVKIQETNKARSMRIQLLQPKQVQIKSTHVIRISIYNSIITSLTLQEEQEISNSYIVGKLITGILFVYI